MAPCQAYVTRIIIVSAYGAFINHMEMAGGGGGVLPNVDITTQALFRKMVHKGGGGRNFPKICPHDLWMTQSTCHSR